MNAKELEGFIRELDIPATELAGLLMCHTNYIYSWRNGIIKIPTFVVEKLATIKANWNEIKDNQQKQRKLAASMYQTSEFSYWMNNGEQKYEH